MLSLLKKYFRDVAWILTKPTAFFREMPLKGGLSGPLAFALITHWIGSSVQFLWHNWIGSWVSLWTDTLMQIAGDVADVDSPGHGQMLFEMKDRILHWMVGAGSVLTDPFWTLSGILFTAVLVFVGARIFITPGRDGAPEDITFESAVRIVAYGMTPHLLSMVPFIGPLVAGILTVFVTVIAAREAYRTTTGKAVVIALFPKLLFLGIISLGLLSLAFALFHLVTSLFIS